MKLPMVALRSAAFWLAATGLWATISVAEAQVYKCTDANGKTTYGDSACDAAAKPLKLPEDPTKGIGSSPRACAELLDETQRLASEAKRNAARGVPESAADAKRRQGVTMQYEARCVGISRSGAK